jgi:uncharacterized Zn-binding protein involved in type VI secretion
MINKLTYFGALSKGSDGGEPTPLTKKVQCTKSYVGGLMIGTVGDQFEAHTVFLVTHEDELRQIVSGSEKTFFEGKAAARVDDLIADEDQVAEGNEKTFVG